MGSTCHHHARCVTMASASKRVRFGDRDFESVVTGWLDEIESDYSDIEEDEQDPTYQDSEESADEDLEALERNNDEQETNAPGKKAYYGKNRYKWSACAPIRNVRTPKHNIISHLPGLKGQAKNLGMFNIL